MKVKCQLCGTKFDPEVNHNICPECAAYYRAEDKPIGYDDQSTHTELRDVYDTNSNNTIYSEEKYNHSEIHEMYDENSVHTMYSDDQNCGADFDKKIHKKNSSDKKTKKPVSKVKKVVIILEILTLVFCLIWPFVGMYKSKKKFEAQRITEKPTVVPKYMDDTIEVEDYSIRISHYYIDNREYWNLPGNYLVYAVSYKTTHEGSSYISLYRATQVYIETSEGITISPLESYEAKEFMTPERYQVMEDKIAGYIRNGEGVLYFILKEDEEIYGLGFDVFNCDEDDYYYKEIDTIYHMYLPELEVE